MPIRGAAKILPHLIVANIIQLKISNSFFAEVQTFKNYCFIFNRANINLKYFSFVIYLKRYSTASYRRTIGCCFCLFQTKKKVCLYMT